jgi:hypothetical protein
MHRESKRPESVAVTIGAAICREAHVAAARRLFFDGAQVGCDFAPIRDADAHVFECGFHWIGQLFFHRTSESHTFYSVFSKSLRCTLGELHAQTRAIDAAPAHVALL